MNLDFTHVKYTELCKAIRGSKYRVVTFKEFFMQDCKTGYLIIMRHDVDNDARFALDLARLEYQFGIRATYYFRIGNKAYNPSIIDKIASYRHEIGYHYETVDKTKGDLKSAIQLFSDELSMLRQKYDIKTACMHGNPLTRFDNKKIWELCALHDFDLVGEPYLSLDYNKFLYFSDSGRTWLGDRFKIKDKVGASYSNSIRIKKTDDLIKLIAGGNYEKICVLTHPSRWNNNTRDFLIRWLADFIINTGKRFIQ